MANDWFRSADWSPEARADFEERLRRARAYNRPQYMRIKGLALRDAGMVDAARDLWQRILDGDSGYDVQNAAALEHLADSYAQENATIAERHYRTLLVEYPTLNGTTTTAEISLAELLIAKGDAASLREALSHLNSWIENRGSPFPNDLFRWHLALIRVAEAMGDRETVQRAARTALDLASRGPVFPRHRNVGLVEANRRTLRRLEKLAR